MLRPLGDGHGLVRGVGRAPAPAKLFVVDLITKHEVETHEERAREGYFGLGASTSMQDREVAAPKLVVGACGQRGGLGQHPAEERVTLLGDLVMRAASCLGGRVTVPQPNRINSGRPFS